MFYFVLQTTHHSIFQLPSHKPGEVCPCIWEPQPCVLMSKICRVWQSSSSKEGPGGPGQPPSSSLRHSQLQSFFLFSENFMIPLSSGSAFFPIYWQEHWPVVNSCSVRVAARARNEVLVLTCTNWSFENVHRAEDLARRSRGGGLVHSRTCFHPQHQKGSGATPCPPTPPQICKNLLTGK